VIGAAFGAIVKSFVDDIIMPPIGLIVGKVDFSSRFWLLRAGTKAPPPYATPAEAKAAGAVTMNYGLFINNLISFLIIAAAVFLLVRIVTKLYAKPAPVTAATKGCPFCTLPIPVAATRCPECTSAL
jgi:large conductance mechanosensitive channel